MTICSRYVHLCQFCSLIVSDKYIRLTQASSKILRLVSLPQHQKPSFWLFPIPLTPRSPLSRRFSRSLVPSTPSGMFLLETDTHHINQESQPFRCYHFRCGSSLHLCSRNPWRSLALQRRCCPCCWGTQRCHCMRFLFYSYSAYT